MITYVDKKVLLSSIRAPSGSFDARFAPSSEEAAEQARIAELAASIQASGGLLEPLLVTNGKAEKGEPTYEIRAGRRRFKALNLLAVKGEIPVRVIEGATAAELSLLNLEENSIRQDLHPAELANRYHELLTGTYCQAPYDPETGEPLPEAKVPIDRVCLGAKKSRKYVQNLARARACLEDAVMAAWREHNIPVNVIMTWAAEKDPQKQVKLMEVWLRRQKEKAAPAEAGEPSSKEDSKSKDKSEEEPEAKKPRSRSEIRSRLETLYAKKEGPALKGSELEVLDARIGALRWALGEIKRW